MRAVAVGILSILLLAGCAGPSEPAQTPGPTDLVVPEDIYSNFQFEDCREFFLAFDGPRSRATPIMPDEMEVGGVLPGIASYAVHVETCASATLDNETVADQFSLFVAYVFAKPRNETWSAGRFSKRYVLEIATDSDAVKEALAKTGVIADDATFSANVVDAIEAGSFLVQVETPSASVRLSGARYDLLEHKDAFEAELWTGTSPFQRFLLSVGKATNSDIEGEIAITGSGRLAQAAGPAPISAGGDFASSHDIVLRHEGEWE